MPRVSNDGGKGDSPRPIPDRQGYEANWDAIDWNAREEEVPAVRGATEDAAAEEE